MSEVDRYLEALDPARRAALARLRALLREVAPAAEETMHYRMPTYEVRPGVRIAFASQKHHLSLYLDPVVVEQHREALQGLSLGQSCVRFRREEDLPWDIVRRMLEAMVAE
jgi:uncharacterized protein YdhG (YjbR/CyaY superfamily)